MKPDNNILKILFLNALAVLCLFNSSCSNRERVIPDRKLVDIIYEMYLFDAIIMNNGLHADDSTKVYDKITSKYGYTVNDLNNTFKVYALDDDKLKNIFNKVNEKIVAEKAIYEPLAKKEKLLENKYKSNDPINVNSSGFKPQAINIRLDETGVYDISAEYLFRKDDSTRNPKMEVWFTSRNFRDSVVNKQTIDIEKDTVFAEYSLKINLTDTEFNVLKGFWLDFDKDSARIEKALNARSDKNAKNKKDTLYKQNYVIRDLKIKYNFEESDSIKVDDDNPDYRELVNSPW